MEGFFSGIVILLYTLSHYAGEQVFLSSCIFPVAYLLLAAFFSEFGSRGRVIAAYRKAKRALANGVISAPEREAFCIRCLKGTPRSVRFAYSALAKGDISAFDFAQTVKESLRLRRAAVIPVYFGASVFLSLLTFLCYYFISPLGEAVLRPVISLLFVSINGAILVTLFCGYKNSGASAAVKLAELLDSKLLRVKPSLSDFPSLRYSGSAEKTRPEPSLAERQTGDTEESRPQASRSARSGAADGSPSISSSAEDSLSSLRSLLRSIDVDPR